MRLSSTVLAIALALSGILAAGSIESQVRTPQYDSRDRADEPFSKRPELQRRVVPGSQVAADSCAGNPGGTPEACALQSARREDRVIRDRAAFERAHRQFHRWHDRDCRARADQRPRDVRWQVRVQATCRAEHDRWHALHDPDWRD